MSDFTPTPEQEEIIAAAPRGPSLMVKAYAGTAKTTSLRLAAQVIKQPTLALAFNKKNAMDLKEVMPSHFDCKTLNGLGHGALIRGWPTVTKFQLEERKLGKLITQLGKDRKVDLSSEQWDQIRATVGRAQQAGLVPAASGALGLLEDTRENWESFALDAGVSSDDTEFICDIAKDALVENIRQARAGIISFDDQIYCSTLLGGRFAAYPIVMGDEAQDFSPLNHLMLARSTRPDGRIFAVGDERQAIYAFRGADGRSMQSIRKIRDDWKDLQLTTSFRCPKIVVERQRKHAPGFNAAESNREGLFTHWRRPAAPLDWDGWTIETLRAARPQPRSSIAILCRNNAPLMSLALKLIAQGVGAYMLGRDLGRSLVALAKKVATTGRKADEEMPMTMFLAALEVWQGNEVANAQASGQESRIGNIIDRAECLRALASSGPTTAGELIILAQRLFARESGEVVLSTIHKAKGLEWELVMLLDPWRLPSKFAKAEAEAGNPIPLEQEWNLLYVAETRTKHTLVWANLEDFR